MQNDFTQTARMPLIRLLSAATDEFSSELFKRVEAAGFHDIRPGHGCVFGNIDAAEGTRLTELAQRANMTKQSVGEVTSDLELRGYLERAPDPYDGRAKIIRLTRRGREAQAIGRQLIDEIERDWAEAYGEERVAVLREALEAVTAQRLGALSTSPPATS
jgi:DNA-binding MarR family transcriptional regulator